MVEKVSKSEQVNLNSLSGKTTGFGVRFIHHES